MNAARWREIERIFHAALERHSYERDAFVEHECRGDADLGREVHALLNRAASAGNFLAQPAARLGARMIDGTGAETSAADVLASDSVRGFTPGSVIAGRYRIVGLLGRGGMGRCTAPTTSSSALRSR